MIDLHTHSVFSDGQVWPSIRVEEGVRDGLDALAIALDNDIAVLGASDIHGLVDWIHQVGHGGHRPMTLVRSPPSARKTP